MVQRSFPRPLEIERIQRGGSKASYYKWRHGRVPPRNRARQEQQERERAALARERSGQQAVIALRKKYGKNAILRGMDLLEGATSVARNGQIGGHKA